MKQHTDQQLLRQYAQQRSQPAFAILTRRYANLVYSICLRELRSQTLAEDAAQSVFLLLARKASELQKTRVLASWLFSAARLVAQNMRREEQRRQGREEKAMQDWVCTAGSSDPSAAYEFDAAWGELEPYLHDALARLKPDDQTLVLLRFGEERTLAQAGAILGISENTARMRVNRALEKLRHYLAQAGVVFSASALAALLTQKAAPAAPAPDFTGQDSGNKPVKLADLRGKVVVLDFWASWCLPCNAAMPHNQAIIKKLQAEGLPVTMLAVDNADTRQAFDGWIKRQGKAFPTLQFVFVPPTETLSAQYRAATIPTQYVLDRQGKIVASFLGYDGPTEALEKAIRTALAAPDEKKPSPVISP